MRGYFPSILALAQSLLRSSESQMVTFGGRMYQHSFSAFDSYCQQVELYLSDHLSDHLSVCGAQSILID